MGNVRVIAPDGSSGSMPEEDFEAAKADGFKLAGGGAPAPSPEAPAADRMVRVRAPDGSTGSMPAADFAEAEADGFKRLDLTAGGQARAGLEGVARGATLGASDVAQTAGAGLGTGIGNWLADKIHGETPRTTRPGVDAPLAPERPLYDSEASAAAGQEIQQRREDYRGTAIAGELAGTIGAALLSGGQSAAAQAARFTPAGQLAHLSTRMGQALLGDAAKKSAATRLGALVATGAVEGFADTATRTVMNDLAAGKVELTAERMGDAAWHAITEGAQGALVGGATAGVLGGLVEGGAAAYRGGRKLAGQMAEKLQPRLTEEAGKAAFKAAVGRTSIASQRMAARVGGDAEIGKTLLKRGVIADTARGGHTVDDIAERLPAELDKAGNELGSLLGEVADDTVDGSKIWSRIESEVIAPLEKAGTRDIADAVRSKLERSGIRAGLVGEADDAGEAVTRAAREATPGVDPRSGSGIMGEAGRPAEVPSSGMMGEAAREADAPAPRVMGAEARTGTRGARSGGADSGLMGSRAARDNSVGLGELHQLRRRFDQRPDLKWGANGPGPVDITTDAMRDVRRTIEDAFEKASDEAGKARGVTDFAERLKTAKREYSHLAVANQVSEQGAFARAANNRIGLNDALAGVAGAASLGPAGALAAVGSKFVRDRSESVIAATLHKLAQRGVAHEQALEKAVEATVNIAANPAVRVAPIAARGAFAAVEMRQMIAQARAIQDPNSPEAAALDATTMQLAGDSPIFANAIKQQVLKQAAMITNRIGPDIDPNDPLQSAPRVVDPIKQGRNERFMRAIQDPSAALDRLVDGSGGAEDLAVVREVTPLVHRQYVDRVMERLIGSGTKLGPEQRARLHYVVGRPVSALQTPAYLQYFQKLHQNRRNTLGEPSQPSNARPTGMPNSTQDGDIDATSNLARADQVLAGFGGQ